MSNWKKEINTISKQVKTGTDKISPLEWNFIINVLARQANNNAEGAKEALEIAEKIEKNIGLNYINKTDVLNLIENSKDIEEYDTQDEFPEIGKTSRLYLAKQQNTAEEGQEPVYVDYNMLFRWDANTSSYIAVAGQGGGGGGGTGASMRITAYPAGSGTVKGVALGSEMILQYTYTNSEFTTGNRLIYRNDVLIGSKIINTGVNSENVTSYLQQGLNTFKITVIDEEANQKSITFQVTADTVVLTTSYNDATIWKDTNPTVPFFVNTQAAVKQVNVKIDGVSRAPYNLIGNNGLELFTGFEHGVHKIEIYIIGKFLDNSGNIIYEIQSNTLKFNIIYDDGVSNDILISSNFSTVEAEQGTNLSIDYVVYDPSNEVADVDLYVDDVMVNHLTNVNRSKKFWNIKTLSQGSHILKIQVQDSFIMFEIDIIEPSLNITPIQDVFSRLYLDAGGKTNNDSGKMTWNNLITAYPSYTATLLDFNWTSDGWLEGNYLRFSKDAYGVIAYKPFQNEVNSSGKTIEIEFRTRFSLNENTILMSCLANNIGFIIKPNSIELKGSNTTVKAVFKEDEHVKVGFVIDKSSNTIMTYINGVISGVNSFDNNTSFRQISPVNIQLNPEDGSFDLFNIRIYDRMLTHLEMLNNWIADLDIEEKVIANKFNDIFDAYGNPSLDKIKSLIPTMRIEGSPLPTAKLRPRPFVNVYFEHPFDPSKNFERTGMSTDIDAQGTSSLQYPIKNYKIRLDQGKPSNQRVKYKMEEDMIPERVFTLKADYMDSSHAHNTGLMKLFNTIYSNDGKTPPQTFDDRVRTTLYGYPIALFHRLNSNDPWVYKGIFNFNLDKDAEDSVGLNNEKEWEEGNPESVFPLTQSFEITFNADAGAGAFQDSEFGSMIASFEPRYPEYDEFGLFSDLNITAEQALESAKEYLTLLDTEEEFTLEIAEADYQGVVDLFDTNFSSSEPNQFIEAFRVLIPVYANLKTMLDWVIENNNSGSFKTGFTSHFNQDSLLKYLITTLVFGLVDNLGKNAMFNTWDGNIWYANFYDIDTAMGLDNQGRNIHNYDIEILDYATSDSWLWTNILKYFVTELQTTYSALRQGVFSFDNIMNYLYEQQISKISEANYNIDTYAKYIGITTAWLWMAQGKRLEHTKRWLSLRLAFLDSKFLYTDFLADSVAIRMNVTGYKNAYVKVKGLITQYLSARFGNAAGSTEQVKASAHVETKISAPTALGNGFLEFQEVWIYGAKWLESIGDISHLFPTSVSIENATKLTELIIGNENFDDKLYTYNGSAWDNGVSIPLSEPESPTEGSKWFRKADNKLFTYTGGSWDAGVTISTSIITSPTNGDVYFNAKNEFLKQVSVGTNAYLEKIDVTNCVSLGTGSGPGETQVLQLGNAENLKEVRAFGTQLLGVNLPVGGPVELLKLPASITELILRGLPFLKEEGLQIESTDNIAKLWIEDTPNIDGFNHLLLMPSLNYVRLSGVYYSLFGLNYLMDVLEKIYDFENSEYLVGGLDVNGTATGIPVIQGSIKVLTTTALSQIELLQLASLIPSLEIEINFLPNGLSFYLNEVNNSYVLTGYSGSDASIQLPNSYHETLNSENNKILGIDGWRDIKEISDYAFYENSVIEEIYTSKKITKIGSHAFDGAENLKLVIIKDNVIEIESLAFNNNHEDIQIVVQFATKPNGWAEDWNGNVPSENITWGASVEPKTFVFNTNGGNTITDIVDTSILTPPANPTKLGYDFVQWRRLNGDPVTFPFFPLESDPETITFVAEWLIWTYQVQYLIPTDDSLSSWVQHGATQMVEYGSNLGANYAYMTTGAGAPTVPEVLFGKKYKYGLNGPEVSASYVPTQNKLTHPDGAVIKLYGSFYSTKGLIFNYDAVNERYDVTGWDISSTTGISDGSINLSIPAIFDDGINGLHPVYNVLLYNSNATKRNKLGSVVLQEGIYGDLRITNSTSNGFNYITSITIPSGVTSIGNTAFANCSALTSITIPSSVTSIGNDAFRGCSALTSITIPSGVTSIGSAAFFNCSALTSITIPSSVTSIGTSAFRGCTSLTSITIPSSITSISSNIFDGCSALTSITIPSGVTSIGSAAFEGCSALTSITIPSGVTSIGGNAFRGCTNMEEVNWNRNNINYSNFSSSQFAGTKAIFNLGSTQGSIVLALSNRMILNTAQTTIYAYTGGNETETLDLSSYSSVTTINNYSFEGCSALTSITLPSSVKYIYTGAFRGCTSLISITIPSGVESISTYVFDGCSALTSITIPSSVESIGTHAFRGCSALTSITIPSGVTSIGDNTFQNCSALTSITIPSSVTSIGAYAFQYCTSLTSITIPSGVTSIGSYAFEYCTSLTSITIPSGITSINTGTFMNCSALTSITIPSSVTSIGNYAFQYCTSLTSVEVLRETPPTLGGTAVFDNGASGRVITVPAGKLSTYKEATRWTEYASQMVEAS